MHSLWHDDIKGSLSCLSRRHEMPGQNTCSRTCIERITSSNILDEQCQFLQLNGGNPILALRLTVVDQFYAYAGSVRIERARCARVIDNVCFRVNLKHLPRGCNQVMNARDRSYGQGLHTARDP